VVHALDRHALDCSDTTAPATASLGHGKWQDMRDASRLSLGELGDHLG